MSAPTAQRKPTQWESLFAGIAAGAVEGAVTYPAEFVKTKAQFASTSKSGPVSLHGFHR
jgi:solute carrier family 25 citrate transporter 1